MKQANKNFILGMVSEAFWGAGMGLVLPNTIVPLALVALGQSASEAGLLGSIFSMGILLPQVFSALVIPPRFTNPRLTALLHLPALFGPLLMGLGFALLPPGNREILYFLFAGFTLFSFGIGLVAPHWIGAIGRCIPEKMRGRYFGASFCASGFLATLTGWLASRWADKGGLEWGFAWCFLWAGVPMLGSLMVLTFLKPITPAPQAQPPKAVRGSFKLLKNKLMESGPFRSGLFLTILMTLASAPGNIFTVYLRNEAELAVSWFEFFTPAVTIGGMIGAFLLGWVVDHKGLRVAFTWTFTAGLVSLIFIFFWGNPSWPTLAFAFSGFINSAFPVVTLVMVLKMSGHQKSTLQVGLFNTLMSPWALAPLFVGLLANSAGYSWAFGLGILSCLAALVILGGNRNLDTPRPTGKT